MNRRLVMLMLVGIIMPTTLFGQNIRLIVNGKEIITSNGPIMDEDFILVPLRTISTELGLDVGYDKAKQEITILKDEDVFKLTVGKEETFINNESYILNIPPKIINGTTMIPLRFVVNKLHCTSKWDSQNNTVIIEEFVDNRQDAIDNKNIYTSQFLKELVSNTPCSSEVLEFRKSENSRRDGLLRKEGKYFDIYYPDDDVYANQVVEDLAPHMDKAYVMLMDLYGIQAKVEIHLIDGEIGRGEMGQEGSIREKENITFVWLEEGKNDIQTENQNLTEMIHEISHNFFDQVNGRRHYSLWINEANAKLIPSLYMKYNYTAKDNYEDFSRIKVMYNNTFKNMKISGNYLDIQDVDWYMSKGDAWNQKSSTSKEGIAYDYAIVLWNYIYNQCEDLDAFKVYLRNMSIGDDNTLLTLERFLDKPIDMIEREFLNYLNE